MKRLGVFLGLGLGLWGTALCAEPHSHILEDAYGLPRPYQQPLRIPGVLESAREQSERYWSGGVDQLDLQFESLMQEERVRELQRQLQEREWEMDDFADAFEAFDD